MRLVTLRTPAGTRAGRIDGDEVVELGYPDVRALLDAHADAPSLDAVAAEAGGARHPLADANLAPVVPDPPKVLCVGLNYVSHIQETGSEQPKYPTLFGKFSRTLIGPRDQIVLPSASDKVDWEVELAVVIGRPVRHATPETARAAIAGYTILNDVSVRDYQRRTTQFLQGKMFESTTPLGPAVVTLDELANPDDLEVRCEVDGDVRQVGRTSDLLFSTTDLIVYISEIITLEPGDIIATGTPSGVGAARRPQVWLQPGQTVRTSIEGVGECVNECVKEG